MDGCLAVFADLRPSLETVWPHVPTANASESFTQVASLRSVSLPFCLCHLRPVRWTDRREIVKSW